MSLREQLDEIEALHERATPEPWRTADADIYAAEDCPVCTDDEGFITERDTDFVVAVVNAWPSLRDALRAACRLTDHDTKAILTLQAQLDTAARERDEQFERANEWRDQAEKQRLRAESAERERAGIIERCASAIPKNWTDPLLTGPNASLGGPGGLWGCPDIERLLNALCDRILALRDTPPTKDAPSLPTEDYSPMDDYSAAGLIAWLRAKYSRHREIEDKLAADMLERLSAVEGYVRVPREPTVEMYQATRGHSDAYGFNHDTQRPCVTYETIERIWRLMLAAAPKEKSDE